MSADRIKVVIIDNDIERRDTIKNMLPDYAEAYACDFGENAYKMIVPDMDGHVPELVIIDGDDELDRGLAVFDWMRNKEASVKRKFIPVIVLTVAEYSDKAMAFLGIDDVVFYEGELFEDEFYSAFVEAIDMLPTASFEDEPIPVESEKIPERIMGKSVKAPETPTDKLPRAAVITSDDRLKNLAKAIERGRAQVEEIRVLQAEKEGRTYVRKYTDPVRLYGETHHSDDKLIEKKQIVIDEEDIPEEFRLNKGVVAKPVSVSKPVEVKPQYSNVVKKKATIVVVDDHDFVRKLFDMTLGDKYDVVLLSSGMMAVDYFIKSKASLIFMDAFMPGLSGIQALNSIRWQNNGKTVPCVFLVGKDYMGSMEVFSGENILGTLPKPISKGTILAAVEQIKRFIKDL